MVLFANYGHIVPLTRHTAKQFDIVDEFKDLYNYVKNHIDDVPFEFPSKMEMNIVNEIHKQYGIKPWIKIFVPEELPSLDLWDSVEVDELLEQVSGPLMALVFDDVHKYAGVKPCAAWLKLPALMITATWVFESEP